MNETMRCHECKTSWSDVNLKQCPNCASEATERGDVRSWTIEEHSESRPNGKTFETVIFDEEPVSSKPSKDWMKKIKENPQIFAQHLHSKLPKDWRKNPQDLAQRIHKEIDDDVERITRDEENWLERHNRSVNSYFSEEGFKKRMKERRQRYESAAQESSRFRAILETLVQNRRHLIADEPFKGVLERLLDLAEKELHGEKGSDHSDDQVRWRLFDLQTRVERMRKDSDEVRRLLEDLGLWHVNRGET